MEIWDLYDENRNFLNKTIERGGSLNPGEYHLVIHFWIFNDQKQILVQKRNKPPEEFGGYWACTGGAAISGENSKAAAVREMKEEMGISILDENLNLVKTIKEHDYFLDIFISKWNGTVNEINIDPEEVSDAQWISLDEMKSMIKNDTFYNYGNIYFEKIITYIEKA